MDPERYAHLMTSGAAVISDPHELARVCAGLAVVFGDTWPFDWLGADPALKSAPEDGAAADASGKINTLCARWLERHAREHGLPPFQLRAEGFMWYVVPSHDAEPIPGKTLTHALVAAVLATAKRSPGSMAS